MAERFKNLNEAKQKRILNAALKEFAEQGYEKASTNRIVSMAGIGKGMLFYYFKNKKQLFHYLIDYAMQTIHDEFFSRIDTGERDLIERFRHIAMVKTAYYYENPNVNNFIAMVLLADDITLPRDLQTRLEDLQQLGHRMMYDNIDYTLFRDDVDPEKAFNLIRWSIDGYQSELLQQFKEAKIAAIDLEPYWEEFYAYMEELKRIFYNKEGEET